jgi:uncharacterized spore protein YtfJ
MDIQSLNQNVETLFTNLENFTQNEGVIGKPVVQGDKTFIPVVSISLGYGGGNTANKAGSNQTTGVGTSMNGGAVGLGAKLNTEAIIVIDQDKVSMMQVGATANMTQMVDKIPQIISSMGQGKQGSQASQGQQSSQSQQDQSSQFSGSSPDTTQF